MRARFPPRRGRTRWGLLLAVFVVLVAGALVEVIGTGPPPMPRLLPGLAVRVQGNHLVGPDGKPVRLLGVNRSGTEYACIQGWGIFDGPSDAASVAAIASWHVDAVRLPLNEDCWLGINGVSPAYGGGAYQRAVEAYVALLTSHHIVAILDLHWSAPGAEAAEGQQDMADADHSPAFWFSVASAFRDSPDVVFDLYNEPRDISWRCWLHGCTTRQGWQAAGMQQLLDQVRSAGATQLVIVSGLQGANDLSQWRRYTPVDPLHQLAAGLHVYADSPCHSKACLDRTALPVASAVPVVTTELGEYDCGDDFIDPFMQWADRHGLSYLGWAWDAWPSCTAGPALITTYEGTPTGFGAGFRSHLAVLASH